MKNLLIKCTYWKKLFIIFMFIYVPCIIYITNNQTLIFFNTPMWFFFVAYNVNFRKCFIYMFQNIQRLNEIKLKFAVRKNTLNLFFLNGARTVWFESISKGLNLSPMFRPRTLDWYPVMLTQALADSSHLESWSLQKDWNISNNISYACNCVIRQYSTSVYIDK